MTSKRTDTINLDFKYTPVMLWNLHTKYRYVINQGGTWSSKTYSILQALLILASTDKKPTVTTVVGQDVPHLKDGPIKDVRDILASSKILTNQVVKYNKTDKEYLFKNKSILQFKSYEDEQDAKSGKRDRLFINEANGISYKIFSKLEERTRERIYIDYNPDAEFWVHEKVLPKHNARRFISNCFEHNQFAPDQIKANIVSKGEKDKNYKRVYGYGVTGKIKGLVFPNVVTCKEFPHGCKKVAYGMDFGYTNDPTTLVKLGVFRGEVFGEQLIYEKGMSNSAIIQRMIDLGVPRHADIYADSADPKSIDEIKTKYYRIKGAKKGADSIVFGIERLNDYTINITQSSIDWLRESRRYKWSLHKKKGDPINKPIDDWNHCWDGARYWAMEKLTNKQRGYLAHG